MFFKCSKHGEFNSKQLLFFTPGQNLSGLKGILVYIIPFIKVMLSLSYNIRSSRIGYLLNSDHLITDKCRATSKVNIIPEG